MSTTAPWLALAVDWMDSEMFEGSTHGARLAWIALLCHVKTNGRAGRAKLNQTVFKKRYDLSARSVTEMLALAQKCAADPAITMNGDLVTVCKWRDYQDPRARKSNPKTERFTETSEEPTKDATHHPSPITHHPPPTPHGGSEGGVELPPGFKKCWDIHPGACTDLPGCLAIWTGEKPDDVGAYLDHEPDAEMIFQAQQNQIQAGHWKNAQGENRAVSFKRLLLERRWMDDVKPKSSAQSREKAVEREAIKRQEAAEQDRKAEDCQREVADYLGRIDPTRLIELVAAWRATNPIIKPKGDDPSKWGDVSRMALYGYITEQEAA